MEPDEAPVWHADVRFFRLLRGSRIVGHLYMDLYARDTKRGGAWMDEARTRRRIAGGVQTPVASPSTTPCSLVVTTVTS